MRFAAFSADGGVLRIFDEARLQAYLLKRPRQRLEMELRDEAAVHSDRQRGYWFGCVVPTVNQIKSKERGRDVPYPNDAIHAMLMRIFCPLTLEGPDGPERASLSGLPKAIMSQTIENVAAWLWDDYQVRLPSPEEWTE